MALPTVALNEATPPGGGYVRDGDDRIREYKIQVREILEIDHYFPSSGQNDACGRHKWMTLIEAADIGTGAAGIPILGAQTCDAKPELVYTDEDDTDVQITKGGALYLTAAAFATVGENVDIGAYELRAQTLESDVATGTAPLTVASITKVTNLNADLLDGYNTATAFSAAAQLYVSGADGFLPSGIVSSLLGARVAKSNNTIYQAATDGIVTVNMKVVNTACTLVCTVGAASPPATTIYDLANYYGYGLCFGVRKNEYYKVVGSSATTIYFQPIGA